MTCREVLLKYLDKIKDREELIAKAVEESGCKRATAVDTLSDILKKQKRKPGGIAGVIDVREEVERSDPKKWLVDCLRDLEPHMLIPDLALRKYVEDKHGHCTQEIWDVLKRDPDFKAYQYREGPSLKYWGHPKAVETKRNAKYAYVGVAA